MQLSCGSTPGWKLSNVIVMWQYHRMESEHGNCHLVVQMDGSLALKLSCGRTTGLKLSNVNVMWQYHRMEADKCNCHVVVPQNGS